MCRGGGEGGMFAKSLHALDMDAFFFLCFVLYFLHGLFVRL